MSEVKQMHNFRNINYFLILLIMVRKINKINLRIKLFNRIVHGFSRIESTIK